MTDVERGWFRMRGDGEELTWLYEPEGADFDDLEGAGAAANIEAFWQEVDAARAAVASKSLDAIVLSRGDGTGQPRELRWIYLHMIEEYSRHNGHADLLREAIDGTTGE